MILMILMICIAVQGGSDDCLMSPGLPRGGGSAWLACISNLGQASMHLFSVTPDELLSVQQPSCNCGTALCRLLPAILFTACAPRPLLLQVWLYSFNVHRNANLVLHMPVLPLAPRRQSWVTTLSASNTGLIPTRTALTLEVSPTLTRRWTPTSSLVAAAVAESSPISPAVQKPSNEVVGGAFVGAFLGFLLVLLLIRCCRGGRDRDGSDKSSSTYSPPLSPRAPPTAPPQYIVPMQPPVGPGSVPPPPVHAGPFQPPIEPVQRPRPTRVPRPTRQKFIATVEGEPMLVVRRPSSIRRPGKHKPVPLEISTSSSSGDRTSESVCTPILGFSTHEAKEDNRLLQIQVLRSQGCVCPNTRLPVFGENLKSSTAS
jgi:hypothetical protein